MPITGETDKIDISVFDVFVGRPATVEQVRHVIEHTLYTRSLPPTPDHHGPRLPITPGPLSQKIAEQLWQRVHLDTGFGNDGWAQLGRSHLVHIAAHDLPDEVMLTAPLPLRLASDYPVRIRIGSRPWATLDFDVEAVARRVFTVVRAENWPAAMTYQLQQVVCLVRLTAEPGEATGAECL